MKIFSTLALAVGLMISSGAVAFAHPPTDVVASNWKFIPGLITVHVGEATTLHVTSAEGVHGLQSDDLGINKTVIVPGKFTDITFTPKKAGTYTLHCAIPCGAKHDDMVIVIKVVA
jgi:cytochrome c oxidase subunit 2